jgi:RNA polymerase sigma-70 factor (ECF subfamily)
MKPVYNKDEEALKDLAEGSERAFGFLYERYFSGVGRIGLKYLQDVKLSQDMVQDIFSTVWINRAQFKGIDHFQSYLYTMTKNLAITYLKKIAKEVLVRKEFDRQKPAGENNIEQYIDEKEYKLLIDQALEKLRPQQRQIFELAKNQGLSHRAIAQQLELSQQTVSNQMTLALKSIKGHMNGHIASSFLAVLFCIHGV